MKLFVTIAVFIWLVCGLAGAWMLDDGGGLSWKAVARGPISLVKGFNEAPPAVPT
jgi:hypothetical protein